jgi:hypothetical protein
MNQKTEQEAQKIAESLLQKIEFLRQEAHDRNERFEALSNDQLVSKIMGKTSNSPYFYSQSWGSGSPGGTVSYTATVHNPDANAYSGFNLFGYLFFGPANFISSSDLALTSVDVRFLRYFQACGVAANSDTSMKFAIDIPMPLRQGIYMGNCFLVLRNAFDVGQYIDRAGFNMTVT